MGHGVDAGGSGYRRRHAGQQFSVEENAVEAGFAVTAGHLLARLFPGDDGVALRFAAGAGRCRDADGGQHGRVRFTVTQVVLHATAVGEQKVDALGAVHGTAATEPDDEVDGLSTVMGTGDAGADVGCRRVLTDVAESKVRQSGAAQRVSSAIANAGGLDSFVGDDEDRPGRELAGELAKLVKGVTADEEPQWSSPPPLSRSGTDSCKRALPVEVFEQIAFVRLVPGDAVSRGWNRG